MKKRVISCLLAVALAASLLAVPAAASGSSPASTDRADKLVALHLFRGTADGYKLDNTPTRMQGLVMLIRLLGKEEEALSRKEVSPFTDLTWGFEHAGYAYVHGLTKGTSATTFTPNSPLSATGYVTFLLRALGYSDTEGDFAWGQQMAFANSIGMMDQAAVSKLPGLTLNRGDMVDLSYAALTCRMKGERRTLAEKLRDDGVFTTAEGKAAGVLGSGAGWTYSYVPYNNSTVSYAKKTVATSKGNVVAHVLTVNTANPRVTVKSAMVNNTLGATAPFSQIVKDSGGAVAVINGNFFEAYKTFKVPIGHVMVNGEFQYGCSGESSLGITKNGELRIGRPALFTRIKETNGSNMWAAYEINTAYQGASVSVMYTPAYGESVAVTGTGNMLTVSSGVITGFAPVVPGAVVNIPADGYVVFMGTGFMSTDYFRTPTVGAQVAMEYDRFKEGAEGFVLDDVGSIISGAPRLVQDGMIVTTLEPGFTEARFTTNSSPRTAVGINGAGELVLVSVPSATSQQMRELMLSLGCVDAFNVDGGASCGMYYNGSYLATPGREIPVTLQVFVN